MIADLISSVIESDPDLQHGYHTSPELHAVLHSARHAGDERAVEILVRAVASGARLGESSSRIAHAIHEPGPRPDLHRLIETRHRREWPTLWRAIDELMSRRRV